MARLQRIRAAHWWKPRRRRTASAKAVELLPMTVSGPAAEFTAIVPPARPYVLHVEHKRRRRHARRDRQRLALAVLMDIGEPALAGTGGVR